MIRRAIVLVLFCTTACAAPKEVSPLYFVALNTVSPLLAREGGQRPSTPLNFACTFDIAFQKLRFTWEPSIDPDFHVPVGLYRMYVYMNGPPTEYYRIQDMYAESYVNFINFDTNDFFLGIPFSGNLYFVVTGYDGGTESLPSNLLRVDMTQP